MLSLLLAALLPTLSTAATTDSALTEIERASNQSLLWGPYRPNLYFGVRPRIPDSLSMGLLWARVEDYQSVQHNFRHTCEQHEGMAGYGWDRYDPRHGGTQTIHDAGNQLDLTTEFVKVPGENGGKWGVRIKGTPRDGVNDLKTTVVFYVAKEKASLGPLAVVGGEEELKGGFEGDVKIEGDALGLGSFGVTIKRGKGTHPTHGHPSGLDRSLDKTFVHSLQLPETALWQTKAVLFSLLKESIDEYIKEFTEENVPPPFQLYTVKPQAGPGNMQIVQKVFEGKFEFDILFSPKTEDGQEMLSAELTNGIERATELFDKRYDQVLKPQAPFMAPKYLEFSKSLFSNLLGGIGYFHGDWKVDRSYASEYEEENEGFWTEAAEARARAEVKLEGPSELFTSIPSRPFFPRGFLWDEGFHLLPVINWDLDLTLQIIKSWFNLIDADGWIAREQILGAEARSKVPDEFQVQYPHYANPPTLFLIIENFMKTLSTPPENPDPIYAPQLRNIAAGKKYLQDLYPLLKRHYAWFRRTQAGDVAGYDRNAFSAREAYRWRGRTPTHCLPSGLDDYPRPQPPHPGELHVDALSWVGLMAKSLQSIAEFLDEADDAATFGKQVQAIKRNAVDLHWDEAKGVFCDAGVDEFEESVRACHVGYISLFPFLLGLVENDDSKVGRLLDVIADPEELWSNHGIRSLSKADENFGTAENYWRGPVWININYLVVARLLDVAQSKGPHQARAAELYTKLRNNLVDTVFESWKETGFAWEQYDPETGAGRRTQHFTGWTSLVVQIMGMPDLGGRVRDEL
ncbi:mannosyl-oligosaccharide glucosidase [Trichodelitschia bisporula]|uniref:Mannosyl-oligosaccharide glucosidase n=1 Tax=Trichodelitschia bisporula TaxID=703511 RepID=A0A6G1HMF4_9PEZI|nr:mannosyl-oligosaccharide glucosidase [Trichodelitschia bisporula]